ncbi:unnamed protein product [Cercospora beticola]|nr:unnamed protein product [Cercospora beticola]
MIQGRDHHLDCVSCGCKDKVGVVFHHEYNTAFSDSINTKPPTHFGDRLHHVMSFTQFTPTPSTYRTLSPAPINVGETHAIMASPELTNITDRVSAKLILSPSTHGQSWPRKRVAGTKDAYHGMLHTMAKNSDRNMRTPRGISCSINLSQRSARRSLPMFQ